MGCQIGIADKIVAHKVDYLLALKANQPTLETDVEDYFRTAPTAKLVSKTTVEKGHGRIETRIYIASDEVDWIASDRKYPGEPRFTNIKTVVKVDSRTEYSDRSTRAFISPSISSVSPGPHAAIGASNTGCLTSSSKTIFPAIAHRRRCKPRTRAIWRRIRSFVDSLRFMGLNADLVLPVWPASLQRIIQLLRQRWIVLADY
jgi:hypothetical protein